MAIASRSRPLPVSFAAHVSRWFGSYRMLTILAEQLTSANHPLQTFGVGTKRQISTTRMSRRGTLSSWRELSPAQRAMLLRLNHEGSLLSLSPYEMRTVRSLLERGLVRPKSPQRDGRDHAGLWFLTVQGSRIVPRRPVGSVSALKI